MELTESEKQLVKAYRSEYAKQRNDKLKECNRKYDLKKALELCAIGELPISGSAPDDELIKAFRAYKSREYRRRNPEKVKESNRKYKLKKAKESLIATGHDELIDRIPEDQLIRAYSAAYSREYRKQHPEKVREYNQRYELKRARAAAAAGLLDVQDI